MPSFKNIKAMEDYIMEALYNTVESGRNKAYEVIHMALKKYYGEYTPEFFKRTEQILHSLVIGDVVSTGNGYKAEVYVNIGALNHPDIFEYNKNGKEYKMKKSWDEEKILDSVMTWGSHGGAKNVSGTAVWTESMKILDSAFINFLKKELIANGIPVK